MSAPFKPPLVRGGVTFLAQGLQKLTAKMEERYGSPPAIVRGFPSTVDPAACVSGNPSLIVDRPYFWRLKGIQHDTLISTVNVCIGTGSPTPSVGVALYVVATKDDGEIVLGLVEQWPQIIGDVGSPVALRLASPVLAGHREFAIGMYSHNSPPDCVFAALPNTDAVIGLGTTTVATGFPESVTLNRMTTEATGVVILAYTNPLAEAKQIRGGAILQQIGFY